MQIAIVIILVIFSALFSGLGIGLLGLNKSELERKIKLGNKNALKVYSVRKKGNQMLCTLLLGNVIVNSAISIILGELAGGLVAGIASSGLIFIFGEVVPQAVCSRYALTIGARTIWIVKLFMIILWPICWPMALVLDKLLGQEVPTIWRREELIKIVEEHEDSIDSDIDADEERIVLGALSFSQKTAADVMTPRMVVFALEIGTRMDEKKLEEIRNHGFTRIPVFRKTIDNIVGILLSKDLIGLRVREEKMIEQIYRKDKPLMVNGGTKLDVLLNEMIKRKNHLAIVLDEFGGFDGLVSMEDIFEEVFRTEIVDESDKYENLQVTAKEKAKERMLKAEI